MPACEYPHYNSDSISDEYREATGIGLFISRGGAIKTSRFWCAEHCQAAIEKRILSMTSLTVHTIATPQTMTPEQIIEVEILCHVIAELGL